MNSTFTTEHTTYGFEGSPQGPSGPPSRFDLRRMLRQAAPLIIIVALVLSVPSILAVWFLTPIEYEVSAELQFKSREPRILSANAQPSARYDQYLDTQLDLLAGSAILSRVLQVPEIAGLEEIKAQEDPLVYLRDHVRARPRRRDSELVSVTALMQDKYAAKLIVDEMVRAYTEYAASQDSLETDQSLGLLRREKNSLEDELLFSTKTISEMTQALKLPTDGNSVLTQDISAYHQELAKATSDKSTASANIRELEQRIEKFIELKARYEQTPDEPIYEGNIEDVVNADDRVRQIRSQQTLAETELQRMQGVRQAGSADLRSKADTVNSLATRLNETKRLVRQETLESQFATLNEQLEMQKKGLADAEVRIAQNLEYIRSHESETLEASAAVQQLNQDKQAVEDKRLRLRKVQDRIDDIMLEQDAPARVSIASHAIVPASPDYGRKLQLVVLALGGSLSFAVALGLWREFTNQHTRSVVDLASITPLPVLATVPDVKLERLPKSHHIPTLTADYPHSPTADEYRRILARIIYPPDDTIEVNSCLIASPTRGDGKSSTASNLAISLSQANRRVLILDVCSQNSSIEWSFGLERGDGLSEVLNGDADLESVVRSTEFPELFVMGPGFHEEGLRGKLASREMMDLLERLEKEFDHVIIDTPPTLLMSDAKLLAPIVDAVIVVVGSGSSTIGMVRRCLTELDQVNANVIGTILNRLRPTRGGYLRQNLELFYRYAEKEEKEREAQRPPREIPDAEIRDDEPETVLTPTLVLVGDIEPGDGHDTDDKAR